MLRDIAGVNAMLGETLVYLRDGERSDPVQRVDLAILLQTICAEFADVGYTVDYDGPRRFTFSCRTQAITRAVTNVIDNAVKHGSIVTVALHVARSTAVEIEVSDDGPGIPLEFRDKVLEPFFKIDSARTAGKRSGFGLGLSIARDIVRRHGGEIHLGDRDRGGLTVRMSLSCDASALG
jgi:signal transduction histidine kinase